VFDHPPINIYDVATRDALCDTLTALIADPDVHVVVFRAAGDHFSAGADYGDPATKRAAIRRFNDILVLEDGQVREYGPRLALAANPTSRFAELLRVETSEVCL